MRADHGETLEIDEHVLEQLGVLTGRAHAGAGDADVDGHRQIQLGAQRVDRVVELVVQRVLVHERRDAHQRNRRVGGVLAQQSALLDRPLRAVDHERGAEAVVVLAELIEQGLGLVAREPRGDDADVDAARVHGRQQLLERRGDREVAAQEVGDALVARLPQERLGGLAAEGVDPEVDDGHVVSGSGCARCRSGCAC